MCKKSVAVDFWSYQRSGKITFYLYQELYVKIMIDPCDQW